VCEPLTEEEPKRVNLPRCWVAIEQLVIPGEEHFQQIGETIEETLDILGLENPEMVEDDIGDIGEDFDGGVLSDDEDEEELLSNKKLPKIDVEIRDEEVTQMFTDIQKTKII
jgi:hypothetical protein